GGARGHARSMSRARRPTAGASMGFDGAGAPRGRLMPWGFRRSLRLAGPLRLNLSKSGLGLSLGVPGLHIGVGPRGRYLRAGLPGTGVYYRKSLNRPRPAHVHQPTAAERESPWMAAVHALLDGHPDACLRVLDAGKDLGSGPAVHVEVDDDVVVTI